MDREQLEAKTDRDLLLWTAWEMGHIKEHVQGLDEKQGIQNGRILALEKWRWWLVGVGVGVGFVTPLLIYDVRQVVFGGFGA